MTNLDELVSAAKSLDEAPPPDAEDRMWGHVAARVAGGAAVGLAAATVGANSASAASTSAAVATSSVGVTLAKVTAAVALTAGLGVGIATVAFEPDSESMAPKAEAKNTDDDPRGGVRATKRRPGAAAKTLEREVVPEPHEEMEDMDVMEVMDDVDVAEVPERVEELPPRKLKPRGRKRSATPSADALADESALLGKAKVAVSGNRNRDALAAIAAHARRFPNGELAEVRRALEVKVLCNLGRKSDAHRAAQSFLKRHRRSALAGQVRSSCAYED